jgi:hypothetical protein
MSNNRNRNRPRPQGAPEPQDYRAPKSAAQREAEGAETVEIHWREMTFEIPAPAENWPYWTVVRHLQSDLPLAVLNLLGPRQAARVQGRFPDLPAAQAGELFADLFGVIAEKLGLGNSGNS